MSDKRQPGVIGSLPSTRPHRRSGKRTAPADATGAPAAAAGSGDATGAPAKPAPARTPKATKPAPARTPKAAKPKTKPAADARKPKPAKPAAARIQAANRSRTRTERPQPPAHPQSPAHAERPARGPSPARDAAPPAQAAPTPAPGALQTAVEAAAELTEIGLRVSARALRLALSRLPRP